MAGGRGKGGGRGRGGKNESAASTRTNTHSATEDVYDSDTPGYIQHPFPALKLNPFDVEKFSRVKEYICKYQLKHHLEWPKLKAFTAVAVGKYGFQASKSGVVAHMLSQVLRNTEPNKTAARGGNGMGGDKPD